MTQLEWRSNRDTMLAGAWVRERAAMQLDERRVAIYSTCERYRYLLEIVWATETPALQVIGLNPSTATELEDDPTLRRCKAFARREGFGGLVMTNLAAWRATSPRDMLAAADPFGPVNTPEWLAGLGHELVLCAWGANAGHPRLGPQAGAIRCAIGSRARVLDLTKDGYPRHPLYVRADAPLREWPT